MGLTGHILTIEIWSTVYIFLNHQNSITIPRCQIFYGHLAAVAVPLLNCWSRAFDLLQQIDDSNLRGRIESFIQADCETTHFYIDSGRSCTRTNCWEINSTSFNEAAFGARSFFSTRIQRRTVSYGKSFRSLYSWIVKPLSQYSDNCSSQYSREPRSI